MADHDAGRLVQCRADDTVELSGAIALLARPRPLSVGLIATALDEGGGRYRNHGKPLFGQLALTDARLRSSRIFAIVDAGPPTSVANDMVRRPLLQPGHMRPACSVSVAVVRTMDVLPLLAGHGRIFRAGSDVQAIEPEPSFWGPR